MIYRPPFAYPTPKGCRDIPFVYTFDASNVAQLASDINGQTFGPGNPLQLPTEQDAPFYLRGYLAGPLRVIIGGVTSSYALPNYSWYLRDCFENNLMDTFVPASLTGFSNNPLSFNSGLLTFSPEEREEVYCPAGGVLYGFLQVPTLASGGGQTYSTSLSLFGVKRYGECRQ